MFFVIGEHVYVSDLPLSENPIRQCWVTAPSISTKNAYLKVLITGSSGDSDSAGLEEVRKSPFKKMTLMQVVLGPDLGDTDED